jgi:predicted transposase YbfD/YdcC
LATDAKSNEITAIPKLLAMLALKGRVITIDAMGCQRAIARQIIDQEGDYVLALKGNQGTLHDDVRLFLDDPKTPVQAAPTTVEGDHGRIESRTAALSTDIAWLQQQHDWPGLAAVGKIARTREIKGVLASETVYYLISTPMTVSRFAEAAREHWGVENRLHWILDVTMNEDQARNRSDNGPENLGILRHLALNLLSKEAGKISKRRKLNKAAWNDRYLLKLIAQI